MTRASRGVGAAVVGLPAVGIVGWKLLEGVLASVANPDAEDDWITVFNGQDLTGWSEFGFVSKGLRPRMRPLGWRVENGLLQCVDGQGTVPVSPGVYRDIEVRMSIRLPDASGLSLHLRRPPMKENNPGLPVPIVRGDPVGFSTSAVGRRRPKNRTEAATLTAIDSWLRKFSPIAEVLRPADDWNEILVRCVGRSVAVEVNGRQVVDLLFSEYEKLLERIPGSGRITLVCSDWTNDVAIRALEVRSVES